MCMTKIPLAQYIITNWPNDPRIDYEPYFNLVEMIKKHLNFEEEYEEFEGSFEQNQLVDI